MSVERESVHQILQNTGQTLSVQFYSGDDAVDPGTVTVTITDADGTAVVTDGATGGSGTNPRTYTLTPAQTANLTQLTAVWTTDDSGSLADNTQVTTYAEVVGDLLFTLYEARQFDGGALANTSTYTDADLIRYRTLIADAFEQRLGYPAGRRYRRVVLDGNGTDELLVRDADGRSVIHLATIRSIEYRDSGETTWTAYTGTELADVLVEPWGRITRETLGVFTKGRRNIRVGFEHGITSQHRYWLELNRAAKLVLRDVAVKSNIDDRATSFTDEYGARTFVVQAGIRGAMYSIPEVNAILNEARERVPAVG